MATTNFLPGTVITRTWCNDVDYLMYTVFGIYASDGAIGSDGTILVSDGTNFVEESGATARTSLGLGTSNTPDFAGITLGGVGSTLSNYAEGTFTPTIQDDTRSDAESQTYSGQVGRFTRIGDVYHITGQITVSSFGTLTTSEQAVIANLPVAADTGYTYSINISECAGLGITAGQVVTGMIASGGQVIELSLWDATTGPTPLLLSELTADATINFSGHYHV